MTVVSCHGLAPWLLTDWVENGCLENSLSSEISQSRRTQWSGPPRHRRANVRLKHFVDFWQFLLSSFFERHWEGWCRWRQSAWRCGQHHWCLMNEWHPIAESRCPELYDKVSREMQESKFYSCWKGRRNYIYCTSGQLEIVLFWKLSFLFVAFWRLAKIFWFWQEQFF